MNSCLHEYHMDTLCVSEVFLAYGNMNLQSHVIHSLSVIVALGRSKGY